MRITGPFAFAVAVTSFSTVLTGCFNEPQTTREEVKPAYVLPAEVTADIAAHRNSEGGITLIGSSNLPEGMRIDAELLAPNGHIQAQDSMNVRADGTFYSEEFTNLGNPWPSGMHKVHVYAYLNSAWQSASILQITGEGGTKLRGRIIEKLDSDVIDSDNIVDLVKMVEFPPVAAQPPTPIASLTKEDDAIEHVKHAVLTVDGQRSATDLAANVDLFMHSQGLYPMGGWSAKKADGGRYLVSFDFHDGDDGEQQAVWEYDPASQHVRYINKRAKTMSWTPAD